MSAATPSVSVIVITRNDAHRLGLAITSVLEQSFGDFEIVIVDDASTDHTVDVLQRFQKQDSRVAALSNTRRLGRTLAKNVAIHHARAELLAILDSDDLMLPERLSRQVQFMREEPGVNVLGSWAVYELADKLLLGKTPTADADIRRGFQNGQMRMVHSSVMMRKSLIVSIGGYQRSAHSPNYNQDYHTFVRLLPQARFAALPEPLVIFCADGLVQPQKIKSKLVEAARLESHLYWANPSPRHSGRLITLKVLSGLPSRFLSHLYYRRLLAWPEYAAPDQIRAWRNHLTHKTCEVLED